MNTYPTSAHRVHSHAATAAQINFCHCKGIICNTLLPYFDPLIERPFKLLNTTGDSAPMRRHGQEQAMTALAMIVDANEVIFAKVRRVACVGKADWR
jgi:hypothetical protein